jgi:L-lactate utilization protein LutC
MAMNENAGDLLSEIRRALGRREPVEPAPLEPFVHAELDGAGEEVIGRFEREATAVGAHVYRASNAEEVARSIVDLCRSAGIVEIISSRASVLLELNLANRLEANNVRLIEASGLDANSELNSEHSLVGRLALSRAGVSGVDYAIAETGTIVLSSDEERALLVSLLPPIHIAVIRASQIKQTIGEALLQLKSERMGRSEPCRSATFITGPSRTSDVELTLSIGVHGPKELHLIVVRE